MADDDPRTRTDLHGDNLDEARETLATAYAGVEWRADTTEAPFSYRYTAAGDDSMTLRSVQFEGLLEGEMPAGDDLVMQWITKGHGTLDLGRDEILLELGKPRLWPSEAFRFSFSNYQQRLVQVNRDAVLRLAEERGIPGRALRFDHRTLPSAQGLRVWRHSMQLISRSVLDEDASPLLQAEMGRLGALSLLELYPQQASPLPAELLLPANARLRAAVEHIHEHAHLPVTSHDVAEASGMTIRALQAAFHKHFDLTPNGYLRRVRLERVREELLAAAPDTTSVSEVALHWGFAHAGRFSAAYAAQFGEYPRDTLRR